MKEKLVKGDEIPRPGINCKEEYRIIYLRYRKYIRDFK